LVAPEVLVQTLERSECCAKLREALRQIPVVYRRTLVDHFIRGQSVREISRRHRVPAGTVLSRIFAAKRHLRKAWNSIAVSGRESGT
jgi:DNA-directed RNA polymerase specialized sigma24 family protein